MRLVKISDVENTFVSPEYVSGVKDATLNDGGKWKSHVILQNISVGSELSVEEIIKRIANASIEPSHMSLGELKAFAKGDDHESQ